MDGRPGGQQTANPRKRRGRLFRKYALLLAGIVSVALAANGLVNIWFAFHDQEALLIAIQREQAEGAATKIAQFVKEIEGQMRWTTQQAWAGGSLEQRRIDGVRLLRQVAPIAELTLLDGEGREQLKLSRQAVDVIGSRIDHSKQPAFAAAAAGNTYYGPVYFRQQSEPYMTIATAGEKRDSAVSIAEVNLVFIWDVVSRIRPGERGEVYVVEDQGRLIAHPDIGLVLRNSDMSHLPQIRAAQTEKPESHQPQARSIRGERVLAVHATIPFLGWRVFVERPLSEAYAPIYSLLLRSGALLAVALLLAVAAGMVLARRMVLPIEALQRGAARIGGGDLSQRVQIQTGDELQALGEQFNGMAARLQESYETIESKVDVRTRQLELANQAKSRFLAVASHDLRQPLHALSLFVAQLRTPLDTANRGHLIEQIHAAVTAMNELFDALLDISTLDSGALTPRLSSFAVDDLLKRVETTFATAARQKGLRFHRVPRDARVRSDVILLERILLNLVSNAVRYTERGGVLIGCRRRGGELRIEVWDTGPGIPEDCQRDIFGEFYRLNSGVPGGLGLGLAIVDRLCKRLGHRIEVHARPGKGSRFSVSVPLAAFLHEQVEFEPFTEALKSRRVLIIDDDPLVLDGMSGLLGGWGCDVVASRSEEDALEAWGSRERPDLIICDYHLAQGVSGLDVIERLRMRFKETTPALVITGDKLACGLPSPQDGKSWLMQKPVSPMALRALLNQLLGRKSPSRPALTSEPAADPSPERSPR